MRPNVYIIAGPNGAGKTTFAREFLPLYVDCRKFVNADLIAQGISPLAPEVAAIQAGRLVLQEISAFIARREDFSFETTLSGKSYMRLLHDFKNQGYMVQIFFLWLPAPDMSLSRVKDRVLRGGHNIPEADLRRRFDRSIKNFLQHYRQIADSWMLFDNSFLPPLLIASKKGGQLDIIDKVIYQKLGEQFNE